MLLDILLVIFVVAGFVTGFRRGLIYSIFAFIALFFGLLLAMKYSYLLTGFAYRHDVTQSRFLPIASFIVIFIISLIVMKLCYKVVQTIADTLFLGTANRVIGGLLWAAILVLTYSAGLWYLDQLQYLSVEMKTASRSYRQIIEIAPATIEEFSKLLPYFEGMFDAIQNLFREKTLEPNKAIEL